MTNDPLDPYPGNLKRHEVEPSYEAKMAELLDEMEKIVRENGGDPKQLAAISQLRALTSLALAIPEAMASMNKAMEDLLIGTSKAGGVFDLTFMDKARKPEERKPLLSDGGIGKMSVTENGFAGENKYRMAQRVRAFYEDLITKGVLRLVETVKPVDNCCPKCDRWVGDGPQFCPSCGVGFP